MLCTILPLLSSSGLYEHDYSKVDLFAFMGGSNGIGMLNMTKDRKMLHSHKTNVNFVVPSQDVLNREVKKVVATQCESHGISPITYIQSFSAKISDTSCKLCFDGKKIASGFGKHLGEVDMFGWERPPTLKDKMKQVSRELETIEKMQAFVCHMEDKDKTYVNDLLSDDKNRMSENVMSAITSLSLKIRTLRDIRWKTMLALERVKSEAGIIFSTQRWGPGLLTPPPLGSATVI